MGSRLRTPPSELARSICTPWRDRCVPRDAGFPVSGRCDGRQTVWRPEGGFRERAPVPLILSEAVALLVSHRLLDHGGGAGAFGPSAASLVGKIRALLMSGAIPSSSPFTEGSLPYRALPPAP